MLNITYNAQFNTDNVICIVDDSVKSIDRTIKWRCYDLTNTLSYDSIFWR